MRIAATITLAALLTACDPYADCTYEWATVTGTNPYEEQGLSGCVNGADTTTVQFSDGQVRTYCIIAERGDRVKVCRQVYKHGSS